MKIDWSFILINLAFMILIGGFVHLVLGAESAIKSMIGWCIGAALGTMWAKR